MYKRNLKVITKLLLRIFEWILNSKQIFNSFLKLTLLNNLKSGCMNGVKRTKYV